MTNALHDVRPITWAPDDTTFGARLALVRQHMRWGNVAEAARQCGLPVESWRNWEEGKHPRDLTEVSKAIADRTGCDMMWLVMGSSRAALLARAELTRWNDRDPGHVPQPHSVLASLQAVTLPADLAAAIRHGDSRRRPSDGPDVGRSIPLPRTGRRPGVTASQPSVA